ncbi:hypothetical protein FACS1894204_06220 [Synergistales bacterium]|nr:hypothetical protein FACS1894204_06220 [Synergistales bacterium]
MDLDVKEVSGAVSGEQASAAAEQTAGEETKIEPGQLAIDESGEPRIPDGFWDDEPEDTKDTKEPEVKEKEPETKDTEQKPVFYTPHELGAAFVAGNVDPARLSPELVEYYKAIDAHTRARQEVQQPAPSPQTQQQQVSQAEQWKQFVDASKLLACKQYLGIEPDKFDDFDPTHQAARETAMREIQARAQAMYQQQAQTQAKEQEFRRDLGAVWAEYKAKTPDMDTIGETFFPAWQSNLPMREYQAVQEIFASRDVNKIKGVFDRVIADYRAQNKPKTTQPPTVINAAGAAEESGGSVDISDFGNMSIDEQAKFLVRHKFAG